MFFPSHVRKSSVVDPHHIDTDLDSTYHPDADPDADADPDMTCHPDADPDQILASK